jgi:Cu(I)/Ag(I) efflux system periplasmic protein CusF
LFDVLPVNDVNCCTTLLVLQPIFNCTKRKDQSMKVFPTLSLAAIFFASSAGASAQHHAHGAVDAGKTAQTAVAAELVDGEVRKIDKEAGKVTLRHSELKSLNMPAMSMVFRVKAPAMLEQVKVGDKVRFAAERVNGAVTIVELETVL